MSTFSISRLEAFSDGVIAIAITLLVLDIHVPRAGGSRTLGSQLASQWPSYAAYVVSFLTIGVIWINHHAMIRRVARADHALLVLNLLLLLLIGVLPFTTALMAEYLQAHEGERLAAAIYSGSFLAMGLVFYALQHRLLTREGVLHDHIEVAARRTIDRRNRVGLAPYFIAVAGAAISPYLSVAICGAVALFYALPGTTSDPYPN